MKTILVPPTETIPYKWWKRVIVAIVFVGVVFISVVTTRVLADHQTVADAVHTELWLPGLIIWFAAGLFLSFRIRRRIKG